MEPPQGEVNRPHAKRIAYVEYTHVDAVELDTATNLWFFQCLGTRWWTGPEEPSLTPGDRVKITIQKEADNGGPAPGDGV